ncbi:hypothetical protein FJ959_08905 [Mesorhizobium sp. B2-2-4]|uniref:head-tail connector protein n=1 Tax=unclassified Mesorhizobium TaxID=325217 RepID=UPI00112884B0|nr:MULTISPECIES: phage head-tail connector protein [unclassified Mesorhizobium]TPM58983.1 hypothetical protein FJ959_08905 [Mesorhizobium sp. B2-2-4]TPM67468.1 hypothetical protein FJ965_10045 [Mesorhizobium sp. B2-2-1]
MWLQPTVTIAATDEPVTLAEAKRQVRATDFNDEDDYLTDLVKVARNHAEKYCGVSLAEQTVEVQGEDWCDLSHLPVRPVQSVTSISYVDDSGAPQTLATTVYELRGDAVVLKYGQAWPSMRSGSLITLTAVVGFGAVEPAVKHAILLRIADLYESRESASEANWTTFDSLLSNHRYY